MNLIELLKFKLTYYDIPVHPITTKPRGFPPIKTDIFTVHCYIKSKMLVKLVRLWQSPMYENCKLNERVEQILQY